MKTLKLLSQIFALSTVIILGSCEPTADPAECQSLEFCEKPVTFCIDGDDEYYTYDGNSYDDKDNVAQAIGNGCQIAGTPDFDVKLIEIKEQLNLLEKSVRFQ